MSIWVLGLIGVLVLLGAGIFVLTLVLLRLASPADFRARPSAAGLSVEDVMPDTLDFFRRGDETSTSPNTWQARYYGARGEVRLTAVQTGSARDAVRVLSRLRRRGAVRVTIAARLIGDRSYLVKPHQGGRLIAWTNAEWAFIAHSADRVLLSEFVEAYPY